MRASATVGTRLGPRICQCSPRWRGAGEGRQEYPHRRCSAWLAPDRENRRAASRRWPSPLHVLMSSIYVMHQTHAGAELLDHRPSWAVSCPCLRARLLGGL